ncbi:hypothetical protein FXO38_22066 [Capsicum annuum]|nr:hypothetical protein FXO38_22066 [Capsicum annuum]
MEMVRMEMIKKVIKEMRRKVMHHRLVSIEQKLEMPAFLTPKIVCTKSNPSVDLIKNELAGATTINREAYRKGQPILTDPIVEFFGDTTTDLGVGINICIDGGIGDAGVRDGNEHIDDTYEIFLKKILTMMMVILVVDMVDSPLLVGIPPLLVPFLAHVQYVNARKNIRTSSSLLML